MQNLKLNGIIKEITERYPNIDIVDFLQESLQIPLYKAEVLATRIENTYCQKKAVEIKHNSCNRLLEKTDNSDLAPKTTDYSVASLSDKEFENFILWLFDELGYEVGSEKRSFGSWFDFLAKRNGDKIVVQALKSPSNCRVTDCSVLLSQDAKRFHGSEHIIVLATTDFTEQAVKAAQEIGIELWNRETLDRKISKARLNVHGEDTRICFPKYKESLFASLLGLDETGNFIVDHRAGGKYDLYMPNIKFPLLTFHANSNVVKRCVFRIKNNQPVGELDGIALISSDRNNVRMGPDNIQAYALIIQYLEKFLN
jgi:HJR/Mrr/RecB family endonuclease